ncbi:MAG: M56 family metallopeptidase [Verrucomicrobia bacterium]|nr:M56 family metallopeptidase [Verrucomicrobiota bacterium]
MALSSVIILAAGIIALLLFRKSAAWRHQIWLNMLIGIWLLPTATWIVQEMNWNWTPSNKKHNTVFDSRAASTPATPTIEPALDKNETSQPGTHFSTTTQLSTPPTVPIPSNQDKKTLREWIHPAKAALFWTWLSGTLFLCSRWMIGWWRLRQIIRHSSPINQRTTTEILKRTVDNLDMKCCLRIHTSHRITTPMVIGTWNPSILLPFPQLQEISPPELEQILIHECAHIQRRDHWVWLLQRIGRTICWINPLYHWMHAELSRAREELCDNHVLQQWTGLDYAQTLAKVSNKWHQHDLMITGLAIGFRKHQLVHRVETLLDQTADHRSSLNPISQSTSGILFAALILSCALVTAGLTQEQTNDPLDDTPPNSAIETTKLRPYPNDIKAQKYLMSEEDGGFEVEYYPWVEDSDYQRIPDSLLELYPVEQFTWSSSSSSRLRINGAFARLLGMTHQQVIDLNKDLAQAIYDYDMLKASLMQFSYHTKEEKIIGGRTTIESVGFDWPPVNDDLIKRFTELRANLENKVNRILDPTRAAYFWAGDNNSSFSMLSGMTDGALSKNPEENLRTENLVFVLERFKSGLIVSMKGGNIAKSSGPLREGLDQYVPEAMKPILANWRATTKKFPPTEPMKWSVTKSISTENYPQPEEDAFTLWYAGKGYIDIPKSQLFQLGLHGLLADERISMFAISLLGLNKDEMNFTKQTFDHHKGKFEALEKSHFHPIEPISMNDHTYTHYLDAFPQEAETLKSEWHAALVKRFGELRANQLDPILRTHESRHFSLQVARRMFRKRNPNMFVGFNRFSRNNWLNNGNKSWYIKFSGFPTSGEDGQCYQPV